METETHTGQTHPKADELIEKQMIARNRNAALSRAGITSAPKEPDEVGRLRERQIAWRADAAPTDGSTIYGHSWSPFRWLAYSPKSEQFRRGIKGRWQAMNAYGGWENSKAPDEWATVEQIDARRALLTQDHSEGGAS